ncbi:MAG: ribosome biosis GTPase / thiamine phosphate phosphatase [Verrucomicrobiota bacterium]
MAKPQKQHPTTALKKLGWSDSLESSFAEFREKGLEPGRVAVEDKHHYVVFLADGNSLTSQVTGKLLHESQRAALPKVGDWVAVTVVPNEDKAMIHHVLARRTKLSRKVVGREIEEQVLVTNVDIAFAVQALDGSFNPGLLQRHLAMIVEGGAKPVVVLNKVDLCEDVLDKLAAVERVAADAPVIAVSAKTGRALDSLTQLIRPGQTVVFIGASGVGKSTLINQLYGEEIMPTMEVRKSDAKGRHTTSWREMIMLPNGGLVIDTPGMREFQMWLAGESGQGAFADIEEIAVRCHFRSCSHTVEKRCAVLEAVEKGGLARERYDSYVKLKKELEFLSKAAHHRQAIEEKRQTKANQRAFNKQKWQVGE